MRKQLICLLSLLSLLVSAQPPDKFYTKFGGEGIDIGYGVKETHNRQYALIGSTNSYGAGGMDAYLLLVDSMGQLIWQKTFGGAGTDEGKSILVNPADSGFVFTGYTNSFGFGGYDVYVVRTDKNGKVIWEKSFGGFDWDFGSDLAFTTDGNIVVCGSSYSSSYGKNDGYLLKINSTNGNLIWQKNYGGLEDDEFKSITTANGSDFYLGGNTKSFGDLNGDMLMYKVGANGDSLKSIIYGGPQYDGANDIILFDNKDIVLAGGSNSFTNGKRDVFIIKFDSLSNIVWKKNYGQSGDDEECYKIVFSLSSLLNETVLIYTTLESGAATKKDIKTIYLNKFGDYFGGYNSGKFGSYGDDEAYDISSTKNKGYIQVGYTNGYDALSKDVFLVKQDSLLAEGTFSVVGIDENTSNENEISIFPNPVLSYLTVDITDLHTNSYFQIVIYDVLGSVILSENLNKVNQASKVKISTLGWNSGVYSMCIKTELKTYHSTIIKQ